jgi:hypothetical protein
VSGVLAERRLVVEQRVLSHAGVEPGLGRLFGVSGWMVVDKRMETLDTSITRDDDLYPGVRVRLPVRLSTANLRLQVDVNVGDPVLPGARPTHIPSILPGPGPTVLAYPRAMVIAEKLGTALQRGAASTCWRDFADLYSLVEAGGVDSEQAAASIAAVAAHRGVPLAPLGDVLAGMTDRAQARWASWIRQQGLAGRVPASFGDLVQRLDGATRPWMVASSAEDSNSDDFR